LDTAAGAPRVDRIDVRRWQREGLLSPPGTFFAQTWMRDGQPSGNIGVFVRDGSVTLGYRLGQNGQPIRCSIPTPLIPE
jgi:hypothetical protein